MILLRKAILWYGRTEKHLSNRKVFPYPRSIVFYLYNMKLDPVIGISSLIWGNIANYFHWQNNLSSKRSNRLITSSPKFRYFEVLIQVVCQIREIMEMTYVWIISGKNIGKAPILGNHGNMRENGHLRSSMNQFAKFL